MSLFASPIVAWLDDGELQRFRGITVKDVRGGPQDLYRNLEALLEPDGRIMLEDSLALKTLRYAYKYQDGGYQIAYRAVVTALLRAGWTPVEIDRHSTRPWDIGRPWDGGHG